MMNQSTDSPTPLQIRQTIVETTKPFLTVADIAEILDLTPRTIRNNIGDVTENRWIKSRDVGQTTVYYKETISMPTTPRFGSEVSQHRRSVLGDRAEWLDAKGRYFHSISSMSGLSHRVYLYYALVDYAQRCGGLKYTPFSDQESQFLLDGNSRISEEDARHVDSEVELFTAPWAVDIEADPEPERTEFEGPSVGENGEVRGVTGLLQFDMILTGELYRLIEEETEDIEVEDVTLADLPKEELEQLFPSGADIIYAGNIIDKFTVQLHSLWWSYE